MKKPILEMICVGTELLTGKANTHTAYIGARFEPVGLALTREHTVSDDPQIMRHVFSEVWKRADVIICSGGLGPTFDDLTRNVWSTVTKRPLKIHSQLVEEIRKKFKSRGLKMPPHNKQQAAVLSGATVIKNKNGTAPGQYLKIGQKHLWLLPGPARELYPMFETNTLPMLLREFAKPSVNKSFHSFGTAESAIDDIVRPIIESNSKIPGVSLTYGILASSGIISVKFRVEGEKDTVVHRAAKHLTELFRDALDDFIFAEDNPSLVNAVSTKLLKRNENLAVAESCTGGLLAKMITDESGASEWFSEGVVTYSNNSKTLYLGVREDILSRFGAVSQETATAMATGLHRKSAASHALAITGIAGPDGGTKNKPVGLVYIGYVGEKKSITQRFQFQGDRSTIRQRAALAALHLLLQQLS